jgi:hypothetical protein
MRPQGTLSIDYPDRLLNRVSTAFRIFAVIPIAIVLGTVMGGSATAGNRTIVIAGGGLLFAPPLLMIVFRQRYPRWWLDWNVELMRFATRVTAYVALMDDRYPSTEDEQSVHLDVPRPDAERDLNRWLPLVKWLLAIPHYIVLFFLDIAGFFVVVFAWFAILFTGRYPRGAFTFVEGVMRWHLRVVAYAIVLVTDVYPPFSMAAGADDGSSYVQPA